MLLFVDMETTGRDARYEVPLELGLSLTDDLGNLIAEIKWLVKENDLNFQAAVERGMNHEIVGPMHTESGLWFDIDEADLFGRNAVDKAAARWLRDQGVDKDQIPMTGNSIGSLDRPFAQAHFPFFNDYLSYRNVDMSSVKELCKRLNPELFENLRPIVENKESATHRVLEDNHACIQEYKAYIDNFLIVGD